MTIEQAYQERLSAWSDMQAHMPFLRETAAGARTVIELGVRAGNSSAAFLAGLAGQGELWSCDWNLPAVPAAWAAARWHFVRGHDLDADVLAAMPAECDVLFVDTSHDFGQTVAELWTYGRRLRPGGVALLHDTELDGVKRALEWWCRDAGVEWVDRPVSCGLGVVILHAVAWGKLHVRDQKRPPEGSRP